MTVGCWTLHHCLYPPCHYTLTERAYELATVAEGQYYCNIGRGEFCCFIIILILVLKDILTEYIIPGWQGFYLSVQCCSMGREPTKGSFHTQARWLWVPWLGPRSNDTTWRGNTWVFLWVLQYPVTFLFQIRFFFFNFSFYLVHLKNTDMLHTPIISKLALNLE